MFPLSFCRKEIHPLEKRRLEEGNPFRHCRKIFLSLDWSAARLGSRTRQPPPPRPRAFGRQLVEPIRQLGEGGDRRSSVKSDRVVEAVLRLAGPALEGQEIGLEGPTVPEDELGVARAERRHRLEVLLGGVIAMAYLRVPQVTFIWPFSCASSS
jgi:hypothetical protein